MMQKEDKLQDFSKIMLEAAKLTPRERVVRTINREKTDRVPFDYYAVEELTHKLEKSLSVESFEELLRLLSVDMRIIPAAYKGPALEKFSDQSFYTEWGHHKKIVRNEYSEYEEYAGYPLAECKTVAEIEQWDKWPKAAWWDWEKVPATVSKINNDIPFHTRFISGGIFEMSWGLVGLENFLIGLYMQPELYSTIMDCYTNIFIDSIHELMKHAEGQIDMICTYDDIATQRGMMLSREMWKQYILPFHKKLNKVIKSYDLSIMYHSCGGVQSVADVLFGEMLIDVLNPLQFRAEGMDLVAMKNQFGKIGSFYGGVDVQSTLPLGTPEDINTEIEYLKRTIGKGGGYICSSSHHMQADTPVENIIAMYTADRSIRN